MEGEKKCFGVSREAEEQHLNETLKTVTANVETYGREVMRMQGDIDEMLAHYHDNDAEVLTILNNTVTLHEHMKRALMRNEKARNKPYFGRIIFRDEKMGKEESLYIGRGGIARDATHQAVVDWRAPAANAYYENHLGKCSYTAPGDVEIEIDLSLKRTYEIERGKLLDYFDSEVIANDELLTKYLAKNKQTVLGEIVATIQKEQNEIIRKSPYHNVIVQGVAGSGKTTVAMHRISYVLYNYAERFRPEDFYIVGSNRILLNYITGVLPDLDVYGVRQMTMEQLFVRLLYEDWDEKKYRIKSAEKGSVRGSSRWFYDLEEYCRRIEREAISRETVYLNPKQFVEGFRDGKTGVFDETGGKEADARQSVCLLAGDAVEDYIRQNPSVSVQNKIDMLNERLIGKVKDEFLGKGIKYSEAEKKAILKFYRGWYGGKSWKRSIYEMYGDFLREQSAKGCEAEIPEEAFDVYDLAALAYLYKRVKEKEVISEASHVVIDEAQDFGMMAYHALKFCINRCTYTVMGDVSQNIHFGFGLNDWEELRGLLLPDKADSFGILRKSYRNKVEISDFATRILRHGQFSIYPAEPIIRHGTPVQVKKFPSRRDMIKEAATVCKGWQKKGLDTIAVICRNEESAERAAAELSEYVEVLESNLEKAEFGNGIMALPVEYTKGLEFDAVLILNPTRREYPADDGHAKLLYVAATRALHELNVFYYENLTGLIADAPPEREEQKGKLGRNISVLQNALTVQADDKRKMDEKREAKRGAGGQEIDGRRGNEEKGAGRNVDGQKSNGQENDSRKAGRQENSGRAVASDKKPVASSLEAQNIQKRKRPAAVLAKPTTPEDKKPFISRQMGKTLIKGVGVDAMQDAGKVFARETGKAFAQEAEKQRNSEKMYSAGMDKGQEQFTDGAWKTGRQFGDMPATESLRPAGHGKIDLSVRWFTKGADGLYFQSRYGTLRLSVIDSEIIRVTFARGPEVSGKVYPGIAALKGDNRWMYKEAGGMVELMTDELCIQINKGSGAIRYMTRDKKLLLAEREKESRQVDEEKSGKIKSWLYLDWKKKENLYAGCYAAGYAVSCTADYASNDTPGDTPSAGEKAGISLRGGARYISHGASGAGLPIVISDSGYGIVLAADTAVCCDIPAYGSYLYMEGTRQADYYFIGGAEPKKVEAACKKLLRL
ncbi:MAG: AAA family ATPase [Clostridium sp.]|nr:AAA family ATPase [Clostridium sp.]